MQPTIFHSFSHKPVDEGSLGIHQVELVVESLPGSFDCGGVGKTTNSSVNLGQVTSRYSSGGLVIDADLSNIIYKNLI